MSELEKKRQRTYDMLRVETKPKFLYLPFTKLRKVVNFLQKKIFLKKRRSRELNKKRKEGLHKVNKKARL